MRFEGDLHEDSALVVPPSLESCPDITPILHSDSGTIQYVVADPKGRKCAIIDPVLDFNLASGRTGTKTADSVRKFIASENLDVEWILETHIHADHLTAGLYLKEKLGGRTAIGENVTKVQETFGKLFNAGGDFKADGSQFDHLFTDGESFQIGGLKARVMWTPGHTPACVSYAIGNVVFVGDTIFMPDFGTARCDFPGGDARSLYRSIHKILSLPDQTRLFVGHDYGTELRPHAWETTVGEEKRENICVGEAVSEEEFITMRQERDQTLNPPRLIWPSIQVNMRGGAMPPAEKNGISYLKIPLNAV
jgi:glyoxylase-like metal-dependent hydrolase (beta-lactamase superfamily II)